MKFHAPYAAPTAKAIPLTGAKMRSGLKMVMTFSKIRKNFAPSLASRIFECPTRGSAAIGSNATL